VTTGLVQKSKVRPSENWVQHEDSQNKKLFFEHPTTTTGFLE